MKGGDEEKQTNEIKIAIPLLECLDINGKTITADALLTQRTLANFIIKKHAHYHFTVKGNQKNLLKEVSSWFENVYWEPDHTSTEDKPAHGRDETRKIWATTEINKYLDFPHVGQTFKIERKTRNRKTGKKTQEIVYGITSKGPDLATPEDILKDNRQHWCIENSCHYIIDWIYDEDRCRISKGYGPENITRLRRFAVGLIKSKGVRNVAQKVRQLSFSPRMVFDYLRISRNTHSGSAA